MSLDFGSVVLGGNVFGWTVKSKDSAFRILDAFVDGGGKSIDTADSYVAWIPGNEGGESETLIGQWLAARGNRSRVVIGTKVAKWPKQPGLSAKNIRSAIEGSLKRLQSEYVDLYYAHQDDEAVPQSEYLAAFDALVKEGKVRALGASNFTAARLTSALEFSKKNGLAKFEYAQDLWSLVERGIETSLVPTLEKEGVKELPYFSLAMGFLTGKYRPGAKAESARAQGAAKYLENPKNVELLTKLDALAAKHGVSVAAISLAWLRSQKVVAAPIASARTVEQLGPILEAGRVTLSSDDVSTLSN
ncbi:MAG: aldo/keto reductase [Archangium sp.]